MQNIVPIPVALFIHEYTSTLVFGIVILCVILLLIAFKKQKDAVVFAIAFVFTAGIVLVLKDLFAVPRPEGALIELSDYAFPSSHAALSMFVAIMGGWLTQKYMTLSSECRSLIYMTLALIPICVGLSRLSIGVHTPFQLFVGFCIGAIVPLLVIRAGKF